KEEKNHETQTPSLRFLLPHSPQTSPYGINPQNPRSNFGVLAEEQGIRPYSVDRDDHQIMGSHDPVTADDKATVTEASRIHNAEREKQKIKSAEQWKGLYIVSSYSTVKALAWYRSVSILTILLLSWLMLLKASDIRSFLMHQ
ncbi:Fatty acid hydroxylase superfamily, partial [Prunus dulcis]